MTAKKSLLTAKWHAHWAVQVLICAGIVALGIYVVAHGRAAGGSLWTGDYETGDFSQFQNAPWNYVGANGPSISSDHARSGRYGARFVVPGGGSRSELEPNAPDFGEGDDRWFGFSLYLDPSFPGNTSWQVLTQWKNDGNGSPPVELKAGEGNDDFVIDGGYGHPSGPRLSRRSAGPIVRGQWVDWVVHIKFSSDPSIGYVDVWRNGALTISNFHLSGGTLYPGARSYQKLGIYRDSNIGSTAILWNDNWRTGTSYVSVDPAPAAPAPAPVASKPQAPPRRVVAPAAVPRSAAPAPAPVAQATPAVQPTPSESPEATSTSGGFQEATPASVPGGRNKKYLVKVDGHVVPSASDGSIDTSLLPNGVHVLAITATDKATGVVEVTTKAITVKNKLNIIEQIRNALYLPLQANLLLANIATAVVIIMLLGMSGLLVYGLYRLLFG